MNKLLTILLLFLCIISWFCSCSSETEKHQNKRNNVVNVHEKVKEIEIEDVFIGSIARLYLLDDYLIVADVKSPNKLIRIFDKNSFNYITSTGDRGQGPGEISNMGGLTIDKIARTLYVTDAGHRVIYSFALDSILINPSYMPEIKMRMNNTGRVLEIQQYVNDTLSFGLILEPIGNTDFKQSVVRWNMNTGEIMPMKYEHSNIEKKRFSFAASVEHGIYVESYSNFDLITICDFDGNLKHNIYGPNWSKRESQINRYFSQALFCNDKIIVPYSGGDRRTDEYYPTKLIVFNKNGDYIKTLETEYKIFDYCFDKENNRIVMFLYDMIQFAYLDLDGIIE